MTIQITEQQLVEIYAVNDPLLVELMHEPSKEARYASVNLSSIAAFIAMDANGDSNYDLSTMKNVLALSKSMWYWENVDEKGKKYGYDLLKVLGSLQKVDEIDYNVQQLFNPEEVIKFFGFKERTQLREWMTRALYTYAKQGGELPKALREKLDPNNQLGKSVKELASEYGVSIKKIRQWRRDGLNVMDQIEAMTEVSA